MKELRNVLTIFGKPQQQTPLGRPRHIWEDNDQMDLKKLGMNVD
jgi:hypothetical protein